MLTKVIKDEITGMWRVVCPVHGELARYVSFWRASYDARQHESTHEEADPDSLRSAHRIG